MRFLTFYYNFIVRRHENEPSCARCVLSESKIIATGATQIMSEREKRDALNWSIRRGRPATLYKYTSALFYHTHKPPPLFPNTMSAEY